MDDYILEMIADTLQQLADKVGELTGEELLIGWGITEGEATCTGVVATDGLDYAKECELLCRIVHSANKRYEEEL